MPIVIIAGLFILFIAVEAQHKKIASGITVGRQPQPINFGAGVASELGTDNAIQSGIGDALKVDPDPTGISQTALGIASRITGIFTQAHAAAVAREAKTLNAVTPTFLNEVEQTMSGLNQGAITKAQAISYLQQAQSDYYTTVQGIIKKGGPCIPCETGRFCCNSSSTCNASCCIGCLVVEPTILALTKIINAGGGSYTIPATQNNGAIQGTASVTITYAPSTVGSIGSFFSKELSAIGL